MSKVVRSVKNVTKGYSNAQVKVRNATSNDPWGPVGSDMAEIAQMTFADTATFYEIMDILDKRLNDKGKHWRHVLKSLKVLDYCLHEGSELVVTWARKNIYIIRTLREFQHIDDDGRDVGQNIRVSAKELTNLILNEERLRAERRDRKSWKSRVHGLDETDPGPTRPSQADSRSRRRPGNDEDDLEYRLALEASRNEAQEDAKRRAAKGDGFVDDDDLAKAIKLSKEEEALRKRELEDVTANLLFDDGPGVEPAIPQTTGWNLGYQQQPTVDWFGNVIDLQQAHNTGYVVQPVGFQNGFGYNNMATGSQGFGQDGLVQPQQTAFGINNNPYLQQANGSTFGGLAQAPPLQPTQESNPNPGTNNPWASSSTPGLHAEPLNPAPTGSNNPFALGMARSQSVQPPRQPTLSAVQEQQAPTSFNPIMNFSSPQPMIPQPVQKPVEPFPTAQNSQSLDPHHARLNALLSSGEGQDTFGNVGDLRIPSQHTAPGTFVNSAGAGLSRLTQNPIGNPFLNSQYTGMPRTQIPAQTGPATSFRSTDEVSRSNPFSTTGKPGHQLQNSNLIDI